MTNVYKILLITNYKLKGIIFFFTVNYIIKTDAF
jgi:hypothetical protein